MTDKKPEIPQAGQASAPGIPASPGPATNARPAQPSPAKKPRSVLLPAFIIVLLVALALAAALWYQQRQFHQAADSLAAQVQSGASAANQAAEQAQQALSLQQEQSGQIAALERSVSEARSHAESLEQAFRNLTDSGSDLVLINDVDHLLTIAQQQLQLSGNVANAVISLETAQAQLARANRPGLASLLQTINGDLDRLRAASTVDVALLSTQLDELSALVGEAALLVPDDAAPDIVPSTPSAPPRASESRGGMDADAPWWRQTLDTVDGWSRSAWSSIRQDLGQFITVRRVDDPTALLMSPDQATRFRENLRLRIMTAQLALMMRQPKIWQSETEALVKAVESRYDQKSPQSRQALKLAREMADTSIEVKLPTVTNSLQAVEALREASAKSAQEGAITSPSSNGQAPADDAPGAAQAEPEEPPQAGEAPQSEAAPSDPVPPADAAPTTPQR
ncbi:uroporphyrinogen-III C-methyltransferase [Pollutimonas bauzanensis]|uniref:Uroporphyrin-3 C-methyltransferase n=1 Tax=Pollutimonas bauzanensis TaxID=658167 RepID=A0A1M5MF88_9BURK|nr:uroporphyrinogen-III C-methyltransferase [Pollutimonas bauzanensis]SHG75832.1 uroporphyrin-3 C-methyltransferase [Pollutimonas bauzanensis]